ncbi:hypothetical protein COV12_03710 [Candidatus Woesearchaeota archaeon CG10_big_fil_rev_8_21_14_0_10_32_24]|nr:MAG: hypothetical protein COV12_03710 [Candidatus Woesearchaeota archaeon CG10_big_fil_rev_8_21_14_0_10_32_24]
MDLDGRLPSENQRGELNVRRLNTIIKNAKELGATNYTMAYQEFPARETGVLMFQFYQNYSKNQK